MIRISCSTLNRIQHKDKQFLVTLNRNRLRGGRRILTPIGGASCYHDPSVLFSLGARFEREGSQDLRFFIDESRVPEFEVWYRTQEGREVDPFRELYEELVLEEYLVKDLARRDIDVQFAGLVTTRARSTRDTAEGALTAYYFEVFKVFLSETLWREILQRLNDRTCHARLVSKEEIRAGRTEEGIDIAASCLAIIEARL